MTPSDPFGSDSERTVIRPNPGGRRTPSPPPPPPAPGAGSGGERAQEVSAALTAVGLNPLVRAAGPLLVLAAQLRSTASLNDIEELRRRIVEEIRAFERRLSSSELQRDALRAGHYALCAAIDDVITNTPWGGGGQWSRSSMTNIFHNDNTGGERFFEFLAHFEREPERYGEVLELMYLCLSLGFEGRLRVAQRGSSEWSDIRARLFTLLRQRRKDAERDLSPHWRGLERPHRPLTAFLPAWVTGVGAFAFCAVLFIVLSFSLNASSDELYARFGALPPQGKVAIKVAAALPEAPPPDHIAERISTFLAPEIRDGLVTVLQTRQTVTVRLRGSNMFEAGSATVSKPFLGTVERIAHALDAEAGQVRIIGYTDNVPIRSIRFPSNYQLSLARATAVRDQIVAAGGKPRDVAVEGHGDADPIAPNTTPEGRATNRRIELVLTKTEAAP